MWLIVAATPYAWDKHVVVLQAAEPAAMTGSAQQGSSCRVAPAVFGQLDAAGLPGQVTNAAVRQEQVRMDLIRDLTLRPQRRRAMQWKRPGR
jgi:hypothetical protein